MKTIAAALMLLLSTTGLALASDDTIILTVTGTASGEPVEFDRGELRALEQRSATMETPWTEGQVTFEGPLLAAVLKAAGAEGKTVVLKALNDYSAEIPMEDATEMPSMLAMAMNGKDMTVREKGPLFLIYPFDTNPELYNEKYFSRSVWQIHEIEVRK
ncbi:MAG: molybdopterin-dependent oxidoreductase [Zhengella sp.]|uniref:molybdopterin-dependent oxidoreductase n=1 Tax=Zhengella sp. TaxID=2282762 RepID=UPI001D7C3764|nr:molybdopterin-dependent oxidoreductase [Notoacmeibacter sp.]MCC0027541.1 molybdopterin-dependent oxidoreductase [Brucellaceae bacterium]